MLRTCAHLGWSLAQFWALSPREQDEWLAYDHHRQSQRLAVMRSLAGRGLLTPEVYAVLAVGD